MRVLVVGACVRVCVHWGRLYVLTVSGFEIEPVLKGVHNWRWRDRITLLSQSLRVCLYLCLRVTVCVCVCVCECVCVSVSE